MQDKLSDLISTTYAQNAGTDDRTLFGVEAATKRRRATVTRLLNAATDIVAEEGLQALTFRNLSLRAEMTFSNIQYYFPSSKDLVQSLGHFVLAAYMDNLRQGPFLTIEDPKKRLNQFFEFLAADVQRARTNAIFMALWDLAQRDTFVADKLGEIYGTERALLELMLADVHPHMPAAEISTKAGLIAALFEGLMPVFGPAIPKTQALTEIYQEAVFLARHIAM